MTEANDRACHGRRIFQEVWREGVPVVVRGVQQGFCWDPQVMARATTEKNSKHGIDKTIKVGLL
jgi:lysine-specific demethylase 3